MWNNMNLWKLILLLLALAAIACVSLMQVATAKEFLVWLPSVFIFFGGFGYATIGVLKRTKEANAHKRLIGIYIGVHVLKMLCIVLFSAFYVVLMKVNVWQFLLTLLVFYLVHLVWETKLFFAYERALKEANTNTTPTEK